MIVAQRTEACINCTHWKEAPTKDKPHRHICKLSGRKTHAYLCACDLYKRVERLVERDRRRTLYA